MTSIEWTDATWNPTVGCSRVSPGCEHCYAERVAHRGMSPQHRGLTVLGAHAPRWTGEVRLVEDRLALPLSWRKPKRVFVDSMSDLFHEALPMQAVARIFAVMAEASRHTFQILTKRPKRMRELVRSALFWDDVRAAAHALDDELLAKLDHACDDRSLPNVWLGVTAEDQQRADERIPLLLETPAALRFVSYEPALGPVRLDRLTSDEGLWYDGLRGRFSGNDGPPGPRLDWVIVGGESGPKARPFDLAWGRSVVEQCRAAGVACFVKQLGARPEGAWEDLSIGMRALFHTMESARNHRFDLRGSFEDRKSNDPLEWPIDLRVRQFPEVRR